MWRVIMAIGLVIGATVMLTPPAVFACSCVDLEPAEHLRESDAAFVGYLISREDGSQGYGGEEVNWTFQVEQSVKGEFGDTIKVRSPVDSAACGFQLSERTRVGIFLFESEGAWHGSLCGQIRADALIAAANMTAVPVITPGAVPAQATPDTTRETSASDNSGWYIGAGILAVIVAGGGWGIYRRRER